MYRRNRRFSSRFFSPIRRICTKSVSTLPGYNRGMHRRQFIGVSSWAAMTGILRAAPAAGEPANEAYWALVKRQFPLEDGLLYFNAANVCPASRAVLDRHAQFERDFQANPSFQNREKYGPIRTSARAKAAKLLNVSPGEIAFTRNTSESNSTILHGLDLHARHD